MTDRPIIFSAPMVSALLAGRKTQTRRLAAGSTKPIGGDDLLWRPSPWRKVQPGERLWVRESCRAEELSRTPRHCPATQKERELSCRTTMLVLDEEDGADGVRYLADNAWRKIENTPEACEKWGVLHHYNFKRARKNGTPVPAIHMPRWASRITLTVTEQRVQKLHELTEADAIAEGIPPAANSATIDCDTPNPRDAFRSLWNSIHGPDAWDANPEVVALSFTVDPRNIDSKEPA